MAIEPSEKNLGNSFPEMAQMAKLIMKLGPDIDLIARISGQYKETIRYRYKEKILAKGFALHARLNFEGLGMQRVVLKVSLNAAFTRYAREIFLAMNKLCYLVSFNQLLPEGNYMLQASVPREYKQSFIDLMNRLKGIGMFESIEIYTFDWFRNVPMRSEFFDFDHGIWDFDWTKIAKASENDDDTGPPERFTFDKLDLLILKELQTDATRSLSEIRESIKTQNELDVNYKTLAWHWTRHVQEKRMINGYALRWMGTTYNSSSDRLSHRQRKYIMIPVFVRGITDAERADLTAEMNRIPFLWCEAVGDDYHAQFAFPVEMVNDAFSFLRDSLERFGQRATYGIFDQTNALSFTISYGMFDDSRRQWTFEGPELLDRFEKLAVKIKENSGQSRTRGSSKECRSRR